MDKPKSTSKTPAKKAACARPGEQKPVYDMERIRRELGWGFIDPVRGRN